PSCTAHNDCGSRRPLKLVAVVLPQTRSVASAAIGAALINVIASVEDEVEVLFGHPPKRGEVAVLVMIAAADGEAQAIDRCSLRRRGPGAADLTDFVTGAEAVPVVAA